MDKERGRGLFSINLILFFFEIKILLRDYLITNSFFRSNQNTAVNTGRSPRKKMVVDKLILLFLSNFFFCFAFDDDEGYENMSPVLNYFNKMMMMVIRQQQPNRSTIACIVI